MNYVLSGVEGTLKGVFWLIDDHILAVPYNKDFPYGSARSGDTYVHKKIWRYVRPDGCREPYNYFPRGRVEINRKGKSVIYMNPNIDDKYINVIRTEFHLTDEPRVIYDYSEHYKCCLDGGWKADVK